MQPSYDPTAIHFANPFELAFAALPVGAQYAFAVMFGLVIGSFLTVVVHRLPVILERAWRAEVETELSEAPPPPTDAYPECFNLAVPRSACSHCGHVLRAWENFPVVSYLVQRGKCSSCGARVSPRYPLIELTTGALAALALFVYGPSWLALAGFGLCATLLAASLIDYNTRYLPDVLTLPLLWVGLIVNFGTSGFTSLHDAVAGAIAGYLFLWCVYWLFKLARDIKGMGYGDFKLLAALGAWLGWPALAQVVLISAVAGATVGTIATWRGRMRFEEPLPFGPFIAAGGAITLFLGTPLYALFG
ncbi:Leader peptidase (Prepilin peptidase) / N-methyltransferase [Candidatus Burkholderia pumila]|uniref:Prepilin leader peptidase/N-methyltransferase n=1 Tax=Candidatus Burkholderia pumila TaxID=1090375 RepID=A0ABR5HKP1_9BURK|nr:Leader peptidase (Prepilin peptidase) / N-methyltransferase [Candidatus Burkholderia pumila]